MDRATGRVTEARRRGDKSSNTGDRGAYPVSSRRPRPQLAPTIRSIARPSDIAKPRTSIDARIPAPQTRPTSTLDLRSEAHGHDGSSDVGQVK